MNNSNSKFKNFMIKVKEQLKKLKNGLIKFLDNTRNLIINKKAIFISTLITLILFILPFTMRVSVSENKYYHDKNHVALYIYTYGELPDNYVTKSEVQNSGHKPSNGLYIGGDIFYYRGEIINHTSKTDLRECDLSYDKNDIYRGTKRLVFSSDGKEVYYTNDHYGSFYYVSKWDIHHKENNCWILFTFYLVINGNIYAYHLFYKKDEEFKQNLKTIYVTYPKEMTIKSYNYLKLKLNKLKKEK